MVKSIISLLMVGIIFCLSACLPGDSGYNIDKRAGFFMGIWHGWIAPISLIVGIFSQDIRIYEQFNTGWWYDFGFYIAVIAGFGSVALSRKKKKLISDHH